MACCNFDRKLPNKIPLFLSHCRLVSPFEAEISENRRTPCTNHSPANQILPSGALCSTGELEHIEPLKEGHTIAAVGHEICLNLANVPQCFVSNYPFTVVAEKNGVINEMSGKMTSTCWQLAIQLLQIKQFELHCGIGAIT